MDLPDPRIEPGSPAFQADSLPSEPPGSPIVSYNPLYFCIVCCNLSFFISNFVDLILLSFLLDESD